MKGRDFTPDPRPRLVLRRLLDAYTEIALCASWLAQFGPVANRAGHQAAADEANDRALELARGLEETHDT